MRHPADHIFHMTRDALGVWCQQRGMPPFRADQILEWVYRRTIADPALMTNLSKRDRDILAAEMTFLSGETVGHQVATDGTQKLLIEWADGEGTEAQRRQGAERPIALPVLGASLGGTDPSRQTECVMIPSQAGRERRTACISSQVGCPVGCRFCASGLGGLDGNLSTGRIVEQVWRLNQLLADPEGVRSAAGGASVSSAGSPSGDHGARQPRITNVVFMGMGEPLANARNVIPAVRTLAAPWGMNISARKITISTVGLPKAIEKLADELELPVTLALSLHAPTDEIRRSLIPWAEYSTIDELLAACDKWFRKTGREITLEYTLMAGVNDRPQHARLLANLCRPPRLRANVNLIRYNEVAGLPFQRPASADVLRFQEELRAAGVNVHIRASRGRDIAAACGQLRHEAAAGA